MRLQILDSSFNLWLSTSDTEAWANRPGEVWPCSQLEGQRLFVQYDSNGLCDFALNGGNGDQSIDDSTELNAIVADHLKDRLPKTHPCYLVAVGQFA